MENSRFLECLAADYARTRAVAPGHLDPLVPSCPEWTVGNLVQHVGTVYLHKVATMRDGAFPAEWPPPGLNDEEPVALLDRAMPSSWRNSAAASRRTLADLVRARPERGVLDSADGAGDGYSPNRRRARCGRAGRSRPRRSRNRRDRRALEGVRRLRRKKCPETHRGPRRVPGRSYTLNAAGVEWLVGTSPGASRGRRPGHDGPGLQQRRHRHQRDSPAICGGYGTQTPAPSPLTITRRPAGRKVSETSSGPRWPNSRTLGVSPIEQRHRLLVIQPGRRPVLRPMSGLHGRALVR